MGPACSHCGQEGTRGPQSLQSGFRVEVKPAGALQGHKQGSGQEELSRDQSHPGQVRMGFPKRRPMHISEDPVQMLDSATQSRLSTPL